MSARRPSFVTPSGYEVMDKAWEDMQVKTFTKWVNSHLAKRNMQIEKGLEHDFQDGVKLINLLEIISDQSLGPYVKVCKHEMHKIQNVSLAVDFVKNFYKEVGIRAPLGMEDVHEGNLKIILGMIWVLILRFSIQSICESGSAAKDGLLLWCQRVTKNYRECRIENFHTSWKNGFGFAALIHYHRPDLIDYDALVKDAEENPAGSAVRVMNTAFKIAEEKLDIARLLDAEDIETSSKPDEKSVMAYVAGFWKVFASMHQEQAFIKRIAGALQRHIENVRTIANYEKHSGAWIEWAKECIKRFTEGKETVSKLEAVEDFMDPFNEFQAYKISQKPAKSSQRAEFKAILTSLKEKQASEARPIYTPPAHLSTGAIEDKWRELMAEEGPYEEAMMSRMKKLAEDSFGHFDKDKTGSLNAEELSACWNACGFDVSDAEVKAMIKRDGEGKESISFDNFFNALLERLRDSDTEREVLEAFRAISKGRGYLTLEKLRGIFNAADLEEALTLSEFSSEAIDSAEGTTGEGDSRKIDLEKLTNAIFSS